MEEDIKILEEFIEYSQEMINDMEYERPVDVTISQNEIQALEHLIKGYKELEEKNEDLKQKLHRICKEANKVEWETHSMIPVSFYELISLVNRYKDESFIPRVEVEKILKDRKK